LQYDEFTENPPRILNQITDFVGVSRKTWKNSGQVSSGRRRHSNNAYFTEAQAESYWADEGYQQCACELPRVTGLEHIGWVDEHTNVC